MSVGVTEGGTCATEYAQCGPIAPCAGCAATVNRSCCSSLGCHRLNDFYSQCGRSCPEDLAWECHRSHLRRKELRALFRREHAAWASLPACGASRAPDPYTDAHVESLVGAATADVPLLLPWRSVEAEWLRVVLNGSKCHSQSILVSISAGEIAAAATPGQFVRAAVAFELAMVVDKPVPLMVASL